jgi:hypothetical protein
MKRFIRLTIALLLSACSRAVKVAPTVTMAAGTGGAVALSCSCQCVPSPGPAPTPVPAGGSAATGGRSSTGGNLATGGKAPAGGSLSTGGSSAAPLACPAEPIWPSQLSASPAEQTKKAQHRVFPARPAHTLRALTDYEVSATICSSWNEPRVLTEWDQGSTGSCTGNASDQMICTAPFPLVLSRCNEDTSRTIYENGTCVDNGCSIPCTCSSCTRAFCPTTNANDTGSQGSSVFAYLIKMGWVKGNSVVNSTDGLALGLLKSSCIIGIDYGNSMMSTTANGQIKYIKSQGIAGGHELNLIAWDALNSRFWVRNSWGKWGMCRPGGDCGYAWISPADLIALHFDANCPVLQ